MSDEYDRNFRHAKSLGDIAREADIDDNVPASQRNLKPEGYSRLSTTSNGHVALVTGHITTELIDSARRYRAQPGKEPELALADKLLQLSRHVENPEPIRTYVNRLDVLHRGIKFIAGHDDDKIPPNEAGNKRRWEYSEAEIKHLGEEEVAPRALKDAQSVFFMKGLLADLSRFIKIVSRSVCEETALSGLVAAIQSHVNESELESAIFLAKSEAKTGNCR